LLAGAEQPARGVVELPPAEREGPEVDALHRMGREEAGGAPPRSGPVGQVEDDLAR
jgi:hypothetical protein